MALEVGGYAEKLGNRYEANWVAYQLIRLLEEKITYLIIEPIGTDEVGVDVTVGLLQGGSEHHQCKVGNGDNEHWTLSALHQTEILKNAKFQIEQGTQEFNLVSPLTCKLMSDLSLSALNSGENPEDFLIYQINASQERQKTFRQLCNYLGFDYECRVDLARAINFLQKFKVTTYIENTYTLSELEDKASLLFFGKATKIVNFLKIYPIEFNQLRQKITAHKLLSDLAANSFIRKAIPDDHRILTTIEQLSNEFINSIEPHLISQQIISRPESNTLLDSIHNQSITLIKAEAGMGKSAFLLELHRKLQEHNIISIPIRLDRKRPENNIDSFGETLGFPYSPITSLRQFAVHQGVVIILDQLDAIRWTGSHSSNALEVCRQLVRQVQILRKDKVKISVVLASRDFDIQEDAALSTWINSFSSDLKQITLSVLDEAAVTSLIASYEKYSALTDEKKKILRIPLWLSIYLTIAEGIGSAPLFANKLELVRNFWEDRLSLLAKAHYISVDDAGNLINHIVELMTKSTRLVVAENTLPLSSKDTLEALISVGLLSKQKNKISFRHQALYDYQIGYKLYAEGIKSAQDLLLALGGLDEQTLTKREHLKYALNLLMESSQTDFCECIEKILFSRDIRFHLKHLAINSIRNIHDLKKPAKLMIDKIIDEPTLLIKFLNNSCYENLPIIQYFSEKQYLYKWLNSDDKQLVDITLKLLKSISDVYPSLVLKEMKPFIDKSDQWNNNVYSALCWDMERDSDEMFAVRKQLISAGCYVYFINWKDLSKKAPLRALDLIELMLCHYEDALKFSKYSAEKSSNERFSYRDKWADSDLNEITYLAQIIPEQIIDRILCIVSSFFKQEVDEYIIYQWLHSEIRHSSTESQLMHGVFKLIELSGEKLSNQSDILIEIIKKFMYNRTIVSTYITAKLLLNLSVAYSDFVLEWLLADPKSRFQCGNTYVEPRWILPGKLIEKFSPHCSYDLFLRLENKLYNFSTLDYEKVKWRLETRRQGFYYSYWGETQYFLLPQLPRSLISNKTLQLIQVLNRKFEFYKNSDFCKISNHIGGWVTSPLHSGNQLSNRAWQKLILTPSHKFKSHHLKKIGKGVVAEASIEQFANSLSKAVKNEPIRFAQLALTLPQNINNHYISAFLRGFRESNINNIDEKYLDNWKDFPIDLIEKIINHFPSIKFSHDLINLLEDKAKLLPPSIVKIIQEIAIYAPDPETDRLDISNEDNICVLDDMPSHDLRSKTINCVRGKGYIGISKIFWENEEFALENKELINVTLNDEHPAVNMAVLDLLLPMLNYAHDFAINKFLELCRKDLRASCDYDASYFFNEGFSSASKCQFAKLVMQMLDSRFANIREEAARQIYARWYLNDLFKDHLNTVLTGDETLRKGAASVVSQFLSEDHFNDKIAKIEFAYDIFVNDDNEDILREVGSCVSSDNFWTKPNSHVLFETFVKSKAAHLCIYQLFHYLENRSENFNEYSELLLELIINLTNPFSELQHRKNYFHDSSIIKIIQRLYDEAAEDEDKSTLNICLDIWDQLLQSDLYSAVRATRELENGLLS
ncbi:MAG: AAA family ATPase [Moraxellaceae bacterium]|nr:MAG: AAA family ATPase [Moraxellaceae bacterium]